jgi:hypothetical protein
MLRMRRIQVVELFGLALLVVAVFAAAAYFMRAAPAVLPSIPAAEAVGPAVAPAPVSAISANPAAPRSLYVSEQSLRRMLDDAYEHHQAARIQALLHILNGRYERRSGRPW